MAFWFDGTAMFKLDYDICVAVIRGRIFAIYVHNGLTVDGEGKP